MVVGTWNANANRNRNENDILIRGTALCPAAPAITRAAAVQTFDCLFVFNYFFFLFSEFVELFARVCVRVYVMCCVYSSYRASTARLLSA